MNRRFGLWLLAGAVSIASFAVALRAATPTFWTVSSQGEFLKGDVEDLSIDSDGRVVLGPTAALVAETSAPFIWIALPTPDGGFFAGTGNEGKVLRVAKDGRVTTFFDAGELEVHALANAPNGGLYVGTSPDGRIYHVATGPSLAAVTAAHEAAHGKTPGKVMELIEAPDRRQPAGGKKLFLDAHHNPPGTVIKVEDIVKGHEKELTIQGKHNVDFVSWWLEPSTGTIMCLAETDDPKGAVASHQETDGDLAEEMAEVTQGP